MGITQRVTEKTQRNTESRRSSKNFELTPEEHINWRCQFGTTNRENMGLRIPPFVGKPVKE